MSVPSELEQALTEADVQDLSFISDQYALVSRIGEGTFSTVYKAEDLHQEAYQNDWIPHLGGDPSSNYFVAIKRIYVTASPSRIYNELALLQDLRHSEHILPIITSFRFEDQVFIVLPYFQHADFRSYMRELNLLDIRFYMRSLMRSLEDVHALDIIHRDIKPCNFLYDVHRRTGQLVDFGLAERAGLTRYTCQCRTLSTMTREERKEMADVSPTHAKLSRVYLKEDHRPGKRANRAGTRGFRAPEVLLKCDDQDTPLDIWSAGVMLLTLLSGRFPFFHSADDIDALVELTALFGRNLMRQTAQLHNLTLEISLPTLHDRAISLARLIHWCQTGKRDQEWTPDEDIVEAIEFLELCLELDPWKRITATEALEHPFLAECDEDLADSVAIELDARARVLAGSPSSQTECMHSVDENQATVIELVQEVRQDDPAADQQQAPAARFKARAGGLQSPAKLQESSPKPHLEQEAKSTDHGTISIDRETTKTENIVAGRVLPRTRLEFLETVTAGTQRRQHEAGMLDDRPVLGPIELNNLTAAGVPSQKHARDGSSPAKDVQRPAKIVRTRSSIAEDPFVSNEQVKPFGLFGSFMQDKADRETRSASLDPFVS